jgi:mono/diheme cytochrome c family protein
MLAQASRCDPPVQPIGSRGINKRYRGQRTDRCIGDAARRLPPAPASTAMDPFELNKVLGATLGGCIVVLCVHLLANSIFAPVQPAKPGFQIAVQEQPASTAPTAKTETAMPIETRLASADVNRGKSETRICMTCHTLDKGGPNKVGPNLWGVVDRPRASHPGFDYSAAMPRAANGPSTSSTNS